MREQAILRFMKAGHEYTNFDVSNDLDIPTADCSVAMRRLVRKGLLKVTHERSAGGGSRRYGKVT